MYDVSAQGVDGRMINVHYYYTAVQKIAQTQCGCPFGHALLVIITKLCAVLMPVSTTTGCYFNIITNDVNIDINDLYTYTGKRE